MVGPRITYADQVRLKHTVYAATFEAGLPDGGAELLQHLATPI